MNRTCCGIVTNSCVLYCEETDSCCVREPDAACVKANEDCVTLKATFDAGIDAQEAVVINTRNEQTTKEDEVYAADFQVNQTKISLEESQMKLRELEASADAEILAQRFIEDSGSSELFKLKEVSFNVPLPVAQRGSFKAAAVASFRGEADTTFAFDVDLVTFSNMVHRLSNRVFPGISTASSDSSKRKRSTRHGHAGATNVQR